MFSVSKFTKNLIYLDFLLAGFYVFISSKLASQFDTLQYRKPQNVVLEILESLEMEVEILEQSTFINVPKTLTTTGTKIATTSTTATIQRKHL